MNTTNTSRSPEFDMTNRFLNQNTKFPQNGLFPNKEEDQLFTCKRCKEGGLKQEHIYIDVFAEHLMQCYGEVIDAVRPYHSQFRKIRYFDDKMECPICVEDTLVRTFEEHFKKCLKEAIPFLSNKKYDWDWDRLCFLQETCYSCNAKMNKFLFENHFDQCIQKNKSYVALDSLTSGKEDNSNNYYMNYTCACGETISENDLFQHAGICLMYQKEMDKNLSLIKQTTEPSLKNREASKTMNRHSNQQLLPQNTQPAYDEDDYSIKFIKDQKERCIRGVKIAGMVAIVLMVLFVLYRVMI